MDSSFPIRDGSENHPAIFFYHDGNICKFNEKPPVALTSPDENAMIGDGNSSRRRADWVIFCVPRGTQEEETLT